MMQQQRSIKYSSAAIIWLGFLMVTLFMSPKNLTQPPQFSIPGIDKVVHFILFAVLTFLTVKAIKERKKVLSPWILFILLSAFGLATEVVQFFIEDRSGDGLDWMADSIGIGSILLIFKNLVR